jgi:aspartyl-tRNA(Asn)/glutamyl-tRNA(Gln) amidotransferase subunit A
VTIAGAARAFRTGASSPVEAAAACLDRIAERDGELGAFATVTADRARVRARAAAAAVADDPDVRQPLLGIPLGVKDIIDVAGVVTGGGSAALAGTVAARDATVWRRLEAAGAVLIGKTTTHELAYGVATPAARNTAGSIRIPSALCGVVGVKPTRGLCPTDGILPLAPTLDHAGPMARTADDAAVLLAAMAGRERTASTPIDLSGVQVGLATADALWTSDARRAFTTVADTVATAGAAVSAVTVPSFADAVWHADRIIGVEAGVVHADLLAEAGDALTAPTRAKLQSAGRIDGPTYYRAVRHAAAVRAGYDRALADVDVLLAPGAATTAPSR